MFDDTSFETPAERTLRVEALQSQVERGLYTRSADDIAAAVLRQARNVNRTGQRRVNTFFGGMEWKQWVEDPMTPAQNAALYQGFWTAQNADSARNAEQTREWRVKTRALNAPSAAAPDDAPVQVRTMLRFTPAEIRFWIVILTLLALLVFRNLPGVRDWAVWQ